MEIAEAAAQRSRELFEAGFYCAESVLLAIAEEKGIHSDAIPRMATGFCSGVSRTCGTCGAVAGAIMALGLLTGRSSPDDSVEETYDLVQCLIGAFEDKFGSTDCHRLIGCDLGSEQGQAAFEDHNLIELCLQYTEEATKMAMTLLA